MYFREVADGNLREKNRKVRLSIFFLWPNRFWPFPLPDQRVHRTSLIILACRTLLSWPLYDPPKRASLTRFLVWPNRFWPCFGQRLIRPNGHKKTPEGLSRPFGAFSVSQTYVRLWIAFDCYRLLCTEICFTSPSSSL